MQVPTPTASVPINLRLSEILMPNAIQKSIMLLSVMALSSCGYISAEPEDVRTYPDGFLCELLDPTLYISTPQERLNVFAELERRGKTCPSGGAPLNQVIINN